MQYSEQRASSALPAWQVRAQKKSESDRRLTEDALASRAEEGRGTLRKASGSRVQAKNRGCPNGETHAGVSPRTADETSVEGTGGTETSQYPEEKRRFPE